LTWHRREQEGARGIGWFYLTVAGVLAINVVAGVTTRMTIGLMRNVTPFALAVFEHNNAWLPFWRTVAYGTTVPLIVLYMWPLVTYFRRGCPKPAPLVVQRRAISFPTVLGVRGILRVGDELGLLPEPSRSCTSANGRRSSCRSRSCRRRSTASSPRRARICSPIGSRAAA
jgi:hypothetical protein